MTDPDTISADYTLRPSELAATLNPSLPLFGPEGLILGSLWDLRH